MFRLIILVLALASPAIAQDVQRIQPRLGLSTTQAEQPLQVYIVVDGKQVGPLDEAGLAGFLGSPEAASSTYAWLPGMTEWALASTIPALQAAIASMNQSESGEMTPPSDPNAFMLGVWFSEQFTWTLEDVKYSTVIQIKMLPNGRFEGATLFRPKDKQEGPIRISHERGTWSATAVEDGKFSLERKISFTAVEDGVVKGQGRMEDTFVLKATGPNGVESNEGIAFVRIPERD